MKCLFVFFLFVVHNSNAQSWGQIKVEKASNEIPWYTSSPRFEDRFRGAGDYTFRYGFSDFYKKKGVKHIQVFDDKGILQYECSIDTSGRAIQEGRQMRRYFFQQKVTQVSKEEYHKAQTYLEDGAAIRIDSIQGYYREYKNRDTNFYYSVNSSIVYLRGDLINERNRYYNEKYFNKDIVYNENSMQFYTLDFYSQFGTNEPPKYFTTKFKTDYDSLKLYKSKHIRNVEGHHYYVAQEKLDASILQTHPFFISTHELPVYEHFVDGSDFTEPVVTNERMWCGNSLHRMQHYDNGRRYGFLENDMGLIDTFYVDFYEIDPNPPKPKKKPESDNNTEGISNVVITQHSYPRRVSTPVRIPKLFFRYEFYTEIKE